MSRRTEARSRRIMLGILLPALKVVSGERRRGEARMMTADEHWQTWHLLRHDLRLRLGRSAQQAVVTSSSASSAARYCTHHEHHEGTQQESCSQSPAPLLKAEGRRAQSCTLR